MAQEPINIFTRTHDLAGVASFLRQHAPSVTFDGPDNQWENAVVAFRDGGSERTLTFTYGPDYCTEPNWSQQMNGMWGYFSRFPDTPRKESALMLTTTFRFSLATNFEPDFDPEGDPRLTLLYGVTRFLDGVLFTPR